MEGVPAARCRLALPFELFTISSFRTEAGASEKCSHRKVSIHVNSNATFITKIQHVCTHVQSDQHASQRFRSCSGERNVAVMSTKSCGVGETGPPSTSRGMLGRRDVVGDCKEDAVCGEAGSDKVGRATCKSAGCALDSLTTTTAGACVCSHASAPTELPRLVSNVFLSRPRFDSGPRFCSKPSGGAKIGLGTHGVATASEFPRNVPATPVWKLPAEGSGLVVGVFGGVPRLIPSASDTDRFDLSSAACEDLPFASCLTVKT